MAVIIGSARINERGTISGGQPGDQTGRECSTQKWYQHQKGWVCIRAKNSAVREKIARNMEAICSNDFIGYDQPRNQSLFKASQPYGFDASKVKTPCDVDCARAVRVCVLYAGIQVRDFYTASELEALRDTGAFDIFTDANHTQTPDYLLRGDILVTRTKGHTVVVLSNGKKTEQPAPAPTQPTITVYRTTSSLWHRTGPGTSYSKIQVIPAGADVEAWEQTDNRWVRCRYRGVTGYSSLRYLLEIGRKEPPKTFTMRTTGKVWQRTGAGTDKPQIQAIPNGATVQATGNTAVWNGTTWYEVTYNGKTGYTSGKYLKKQ